MPTSYRHIFIITIRERTQTLPYEQFLKTNCRDRFASQAFREVTFSKKKSEGLSTVREFYLYQRVDVGRLFRCAREMSRSDRERRVRQTDPYGMSMWYTVGNDLKCRSVFFDEI
jgi:hypothetical protein